MPKFPSNTCRDYIVDGNLPQHKIKDCVSTIIDDTTMSGIRDFFPWVGIEHFHYYHFKCPYSTESEVHYVRGSDFLINDVVSEAVSHTSTSGLMIRHSRGVKHGWLCVDPICPYYNGTASGSIAGTPYFYI